MLACPVCSYHPLCHRAFDTDSSDGTVDGVAWCHGCWRWYPIEDGILELLAEGTAYADDRHRFWCVHQDRLAALGLKASHDLPTESGAAAQRLQQKHFDWYATNADQSYSEFTQTPFWRS